MLQRDPLLDLASAAASARRWVGALIGFSAGWPLMLLAWEERCSHPSRDLPTLLAPAAAALFIGASATFITYVPSAVMRAFCWAFGGIAFGMVFFASLSAVWPFRPSGFFGSWSARFDDLQVFFMLSTPVFLFTGGAVAASTAPLFSARLSKLWTAVPTAATCGLVWAAVLAVFALKARFFSPVVASVPLVVLSACAWWRARTEQTRMRAFIGAVLRAEHPAYSLGVVADEPAEAASERAFVDVKRSEVPNPRIGIVRGRENGSVYRAVRNETVASLYWAE